MFSLKILLRTIVSSVKDADIAEVEILGAITLLFGTYIDFVKVWHAIFSQLLN